MKFLWTTIEVTDLAASKAFYQEVVGLSVAREFSGGGTHIVFLGSGDTLVELIASDDEPARSAGDGISLGFAVEDLDAKIASLAGQGIAVAEGPFAPNPSIRFFFIRDPDNVRIQFVEERP